MAHRHGKRAEGPPARSGLFSAGRMFGFLWLAGMGLALLAIVVLLPAYASLSEARYELAGREAGVRRAEALVQANSKLMAALPDDETLTKRLAMSYGQLWPTDEVVVTDPGQGRPVPPDVVRMPAVEDAPPRPPSWLLSAASKLHRVQARRALMLLATAALVTGFLLFSPPQRSSRMADRPRGPGASPE